MTGPAYGALLDAVRGVHWPARRAVTNAMSGAHHSKLRGTSAEFTEYRLYRQGDDPRRIDWRLLGRSDRAYIRLATDRATLPTMLVLDTSASMAYPVATRAKWRFAQEIAVALAAVVHADGDPIGVALSDDTGQRHVLPPRTRRGVVSEVARVVDARDPDGANALAPIVATLRNPRIAIITDLLGDADELLGASAVHMAAGREVHVIHIIAREELDPPRRPILAADPEAPMLQRLLLDATRPLYEQRFAEWRAEIARRWRVAGAGYVEVVTDEGVSHAVRRIVEGPSVGGARQ
jgi:uncharacterized protein (DUF58 family)